MRASIISVKKGKTHLFLRTIQKLPAFGIRHSHLFGCCMNGSFLINILQKMKQSRPKKIRIFCQDHLCLDTKLAVLCFCSTFYIFISFIHSAFLLLLFFLP